MELSEVAPPRGFCAAPWIEAVVRISGNVLPCCRAGRVFGNVESAPLAEIWKGRVAQEFRAKIGAGEFPSPECESCYRDGTQTTLRKDLDSVVDTIVKVGTVLQRCERITDIEINPLLVYEHGRGVKAVDVRILLTSGRKGV